MKLSTKFNFGAIQKPLASYRDHGLNLSRKKIRTHIMELENWIKLNSKFFNKNFKNWKYLKIYLFKLKIKNFFRIWGV